MHYNWHRYYAPETGRYMTPDPIGLEGGMNLYGYVGGNPVNYVDPWGLHGTHPWTFPPGFTDPENNPTWYNDPNGPLSGSIDLGTLTFVAGKHACDAAIGLTYPLFIGVLNPDYYGPAEADACELPKDKCDDSNP